MSEEKKEKYSFLVIEEKKPILLIQENERRKQERRKKTISYFLFLFNIFEYFSYGAAILILFSFLFFEKINTFSPLWQNVYIPILVPFFIGIGFFFKSEKHLG